MFTAEFSGINSFLVGVAQKLLTEGIKRNTRGEESWELPYPIIIKINNPSARWITIAERKWNMYLPYGESLWLATGRNDLGMIASYFPNMSKFSDDNRFVRAGYGPRFRYYNGNAIDYKRSIENAMPVFLNKEVDQFKYISECFKEDISTRRGVITIGDPPKDEFDVNGNLKKTKDIPCTRTLQFLKQANTNKLDLVVHMRSNDLIWGASGVNIFNFMFMQEYFSSILGTELGNYYHIANNMHFYKRHEKMLEQIALQSITDESYLYDKTFHSLHEFDILLAKLGHWEQDFRTRKTNKLANFDDDFFNDWAKVLYQQIKKEPIKFTNPILNQLSISSNR